MNQWKFSTGSSFDFELKVLFRGFSIEIEIGKSFHIFIAKQS